ncbi:hypothetical protein ABZ801_41045 [Actinomadura sp. NPDC047616]
MADVTRKLVKDVKGGDEVIATEPNPLVEGEPQHPPESSVGSQ